MIINNWHFRHIWWYNIPKSQLKWCREIRWGLPLPLQWCCMGSNLVRFYDINLNSICQNKDVTVYVSLYMYFVFDLQFLFRGMISFTFLCGSLYLGLVILSWGNIYFPCSNPLFDWVDCFPVLSIIIRL